VVEGNRTFVANWKSASLPIPICYFSKRRYSVSFSFLHGGIAHWIIIATASPANNIYWERFHAHFRGVQ
jgi:hypothetical protein